MTRRVLSIVTVAALFAALCLAGCSGDGGSAGGKMKDGTFTGQSSTLEANVDGDGYAIVSITVKDGKIVDANIQSFLPDGTFKGEDYGKDGAYYGVAQKVISTRDEYAKALVEAGSIDGVDVISGATFLYDQVVEATEAAIEEASK